MSDTHHLFCFGLGFTTITLGKELLKQGWQVSGTTRSQKKADQLEKYGFGVIVLDEDISVGAPCFEKMQKILSTASHVINSTPPDEKGDIIAPIFSQLYSVRKVDLKWFGYLSTIGVYGEHHGAWIDEEAELFPVTKRSKWRRKAELQWLDLTGQLGLPLHIFRLPGIYGKGRNQMVTLQKGKSRRLVKKGQVFNRIHVEDIAQILKASMAKISVGEIYNISDDMPCPPQDVVLYAATLLKISPPPIVKYEEADLTPMARSFYGECKQIRNDKIKKNLDIKLKYPTYKEGLSALFQTLDED